MNRASPDRDQELLHEWLLLVLLSTFRIQNFKSYPDSDLTQSAKYTQNLWRVRKRTAILIDKIKVISTRVAAQA